jgi:bifunctional polynucleotide phosphatase/kinase
MQRQKCVKVAKEHLTAGTSVAVGKSDSRSANGVNLKDIDELLPDNTNADPETRAHWTELAKELKIPIRCIFFTAAPALCKHNDAVRAANPNLVSSRPTPRPPSPSPAENRGLESTPPPSF